MKRQITLGIPKGSLQRSTTDLFEKAGYKILVRDRSYVPVIDDPEIRCLMFRAQEMARYVERGVLDVGLTGQDWILENQADVVEVAELVYSKSTTQAYRWVLAVPEESTIQSVQDLEGKRIATELVQATRQYLQRNGVKAEVEYSWGATEIKAPLLVDAIVEGTETGASLRANRLRIIDTVAESTTKLVASKPAWADAWKREKIEILAMLLTGALVAERKVGVKMNVPRARLDDVSSQLPSLHTPTISSQVDPEWVALEVIIDKAVARDLIPKLKKAGAEGIVEYPLNKVIY
ncbi:MAG: ATP phosphoribosyltransferase [candidate division NC10 bacterium]|nr:ATP phosphoribosyltransferase [candidate division NC10 bacterium]